ncbi:MAG: hypothetical protein LUE27_05560 [Clostridia bacterium]|nr:hypothetical protein [Clostridia bacterium]
MDAAIRLGKISTVNYPEGKARVTYEDRDQAVTKELPFLAWMYRPPKIGDLVIVACFANGNIAGVILGPIYSTANVPYEGAEDKSRIELHNTANEAAVSYDATKRTLTVRAPKMEFEGYGYDDKALVTLEEINQALADIDDVKTRITNLYDRLGIDYGEDEDDG